MKGRLRERKGERDREREREREREKDRKRKRERTNGTNVPMSCMELVIESKLVSFLTDQMFSAVQRLLGVIETS